MNLRFARRIAGILTILCPLAVSSADVEWFPFDPAADRFNESPIDLRHLNEKFAGENGFIAARGEEFIHSSTKESVRFWAVNGPPHELHGEALQKSARRLAKYGVNLVRLHSGIFNRRGEADLEKIEHAREVVGAMKNEGIYSHFSIYFPLWMKPAADHPWLKGYDGSKHPFAALMFNPEFQKHYRSWWKALLLTPGREGRKLIDEPAVFGLEIQNEDSFFFWTFNPDEIPDPQIRILEGQFADWLTEKHGSLQAALEKWNGLKLKRDNFEENRVALRPLWNMFNEKTARDKDTAEFLFDTQRRFYEETIKFLRGLGFKGLITASNWATASPEVFGPLERWSYTSGDFIDRHGYFSVAHKGENAAWSIRPGHTYADRRALAFEPASPGKPREFVHPAMDVVYNNKPSMISETTWNRPNRFRGEAPLYFASYGSLQGTDAIVHFAYDGDKWSVKPNYWMQPWTLMSPSQMAQFPAAALIFRQQLIKPGDLLAKINLNTKDLLNLKGTPLPQDASFDELRQADVPSGTELKPGQRIDPLIHYSGRTAVNFTERPSATELTPLSNWIDHKAKKVRSTTGELSLDYGKALLTINAPSAQGASGNLKAAGTIALRDFSIESAMDNGHIVLVSLDGQRLGTSKRMLLQVMSEEQPTGWATEDAGNGIRRITSIGRDPWQVKRINGSIQFGDSLTVQPLDFNGYPVSAPSNGSSLKLAPETIYYLVTR